MNDRTQSLLRHGALVAVATTLLLGCSKKPEDVLAVDPPSTTAGTMVDDSVITASVKSALLAEPDIKSFDLQAETRKGIVQLSGFVDSQTQIDRALVVVRGISGVMSVENGITLKGKPTTIGTQVDDAAVTGRVKTALLADPDIKSMDISVQTLKGQVQLTGFVNSQAQIDQAAAIARVAEGASSVKNELMIKR